MPIGPGRSPPSPLCRNSANSRRTPGLSGPNRNSNLTSLQIEGLAPCDGGILARGERNLGRLPIPWALPPKVKEVFAAYPSMGVMPRSVYCNHGSGISPAHASTQF